MESIVRQEFEIEPFRGFGPSAFWPFRRRSQTLTVTDDLAEVRRIMRERMPAPARRVWDDRPPRPADLCRHVDDAAEAAGHILSERRRDAQGISDRVAYRSTRMGSHRPRPRGAGARAGIDPTASTAVQRERAAIGPGDWVTFSFRAKTHPACEWRGRCRAACDIRGGRWHSTGRFAKRSKPSIGISNCAIAAPIRRCILPSSSNLFSLELRADCVRGETGSCLGPCAGQCTRNAIHRRNCVPHARFLDGRDSSPLNASWKRS